MTGSNSPKRDRNSLRQSANPEKYARLKAELKAPYRGLRQFIYVAFGASGFIGAFIFLMQAIAGRDLDSTLPNLALQTGVIALMVWLFRLEQKAERKSRSSND